MVSPTPRPRAGRRAAGVLATTALVSGLAGASAATGADRPDPGGAAPDVGAPLFGANYSGAADVDEEVYGGRAEVARVFFRQVQGRSWERSGSVREALADGVDTFVISWKERDLADVREFLAAIPDDLTVYGSFHHEPENDAGRPGSGAYAAWSEEWRQAWRDQSAAMRSEGVVPTAIIMAYTLVERSGRTLAEWLPPAGTIDVLAFDAYLRGRDPERAVARMVAAAAGAGIEHIGIAETGGPADDPERLDKVRTLKAAVTEAGGTFLWALFWNARRGGWDGRMDAATADAWFD